LSTAFTGAKLALLLDGAVLVALRDDIAAIPWPNYWDLPGGGREGGESPAACVLRELQKEFGLALPADRLVHERAYPSMSHPGAVNWFFGGHLLHSEVTSIRFGDEGQDWRMMRVEEFLSRPDAVPHLQDRLRDWLNGDGEE
jgi:8-oxo-dGTP diphosphatase